ncbi:ChaN family lipoprotein [Pseudoalteromonas spongiae]|uniref:ChaN family lipoprotein n=1 Tax=Pseudoalteromonas spongiae TaxID=298657 RepID=UPI0037363208
MLRTKLSFIVLSLSMLLTACQSTHIPSHKKTVSVLVQNNEQWHLATPLTSLYDYQLIDVRSGQPKTVDLAKGIAELSDYDVIFIGENHRHPGNHLAQANIYRALLKAYPKTILSLEQFERDTQTYLNAYLNGEIGEWSLRHFGRAWDNYQSSYRPLVEMAKTHGLPVIAANAPKDTVVCTGRHGLEILDNLPEKRKHQVAQSFYTPTEGAYFNKFTANMGHRQETIKPSTLNRYFAQVVRDDTMAESIHNALENHPNHKLVHLNGHFHSASHLGTVERVMLRKRRKVAVIQPILVDNPSAPSFSVDDINKGDYLLLIHPLPEQVKTQENRRIWMQTVFKRSEQDCTFGTK